MSPTPKPLNFLITGAGRGIGRGLSRLLVSKGHKVYLVDSDIEELHQNHEYLVSNYSSPSYAKHAISACDNHLDCLINNAAVTGAVGAHDFADLPLEEWNKSIQTNLTAPMLLSQLMLPALKNAKGSIINISSTRAHQSEPNSEPYAATKAGLLGLTHAMACSLSNTGVRVNAILPGWINVANECREADEKGMKWEDGLSEDDHRWHWTGRVGKVEDVLKAVEYLVGADFVTGQEVVVDGGVTRKMVYPE